jgi:hypothetical protein
MKRTAVSFVALAAFASGALAADQSKNDVRVVNTPAESVPVAVQGTASVAGTVEVTNVVPVRPLETAPRETFFVLRSIDIPAGDCCDIGPLKTVDGQAWVVPEGKIAVLEHVSSRLKTTTGVEIIMELTSSGAGQQFGAHYIVFGSVQERVAAGVWTAVRTASQPLKLYMPAGASISTTTTIAGGAEVSGVVNATGYYAPAP